MCEAERDYEELLKVSSASLYRFIFGASAQCGDWIFFWLAGARLLASDSYNLNWTPLDASRRAGFLLRTCLLALGRWFLHSNGDDTARSQAQHSTSRSDFLDILYWAAL